jgi:CRP-like cAMP-binding protein
MLSAETRKLRARCERLSLPTLRERVIHLIETEGTRGAFTATGGFKALSSDLGATHEALYRALAAMEKSGAISRDGHTIALI